MKTYETLTESAREADEWIEYYEHVRDKADFMAEHLPECILEMEGAYQLAKSWLRYRQGWFDLPCDTRRYLEEAARYMGNEDGVMYVHLEIDGELIIIELGVSREDWHGSA